MRIYKASIRRNTARRPKPLRLTTSTFRCHAIKTCGSESARRLSFPTRDMADQSRSARFQALFESALQAYEKKTGITLAKHPLAVQLQSCHSVEDVNAVFQGQAKAFSDFQASGKIMKAIKTTVSILTPISGAAAFADAVGLVRQKVLMRMSYISEPLLSRHCSHPQKQYRLV